MKPRHAKPTEYRPSAPSGQAVWVASATPLPHWLLGLPLPIILIARCSGAWLHPLGKRLVSITETAI